MPQPETAPTAALLRKALQAQSAAKYRERTAATVLENAGKAIDMLQADLAEVTRQRDALREACVRLHREIDERRNLKGFHDFFCNGVHADNGLCEGEHWIAEALDKARAALSQCPRPAQTGVADAAT